MNDEHTDNQDHSTDTSYGDPWEGEMSSAFDRRVRDLHEAPLSVDEIKGKAMTIQRKRRAAAAGGILAAAAVIVPVAVLATNATGDDRTSIDVATPSTTAVDTPTGTPTPAAPLVPSYVEGTSYHRADGSVFELPGAAYEDAATLGNRVVASSRDDQGNITVDLIEGDQVVDSYPAGSDFTVSESGDTVAFVTGAGDVQTIWPDGEAVLADGYAGWSVRAVDSRGDCLDPEAGGAGCRVFLKDDGPSGATTAVDSHGIADPPVPDATMIYDADGQGRLAVVNKVLDAGSCGGVYDETNGAYVFETCDYTLKDFSPDGAHILAAPAYLDGLTDSFATVLDTTDGAEVAQVAPTKDYVFDATWLDDRTIAVQVFDFDARTWSIRTITLGSDKTVTVVGPTPGEEGLPPFHLVG